VIALDAARKPSLCFIPRHSIPLPILETQAGNQARQ
jgi:hypothetical protein